MMITAVVNSIDRSTEDRAPIPSKGKQRFGALSSVERSIELTTAGKEDAMWT